MCSPGYCWSSGVPSPNAGIPPGGLVENKVIEIGGAYTITISATFKNCTFIMSGDARINISPVGTTPINVTFDNCDLFGCGQMWQGIAVDATGASGDFTFNFLNGTIEDAYIGLRLDELKGDYSIADNTFRNNHIGISNVRQNGGTLNGIIVRNHFWQSANLATRVGSLAPPFPMPDYPLAHAGVKYVNVVSAVGVLQTIQTGNTVNIFECLKYGIVTEGGSTRVQSTSNQFKVMGLYGVYATDGAVRVVACQFLESGIHGIQTVGASLKAQHNVFSGLWQMGIRATQNFDGEGITINEENQFTINADSWMNGIYVDRPPAFSGTSCVIDGNIFTVLAHRGDGHTFRCIYVDDFADATDEMEISWNQITANDTMGGVFGIWIRMGSSDQFNVHDNTIHSGTISTLFNNWGIVLQDIGGQNLTNGHIIRHNNLSGVNIDGDGGGFTALECGTHSMSIDHVEFCDNIMDKSDQGLHFLFANDVELRSNHFNAHYIALRIEGAPDARIGKQDGRGNQWDLDPDACVKYAAQATHGDPLNSEFLVSQGNVLPWLPPNHKLDPDPTSGPNWFHEGGDPDAICQSPLEPPPARELTPSEIEAVLGTSILSGVNLWDLQREVYAKLLVFPELRPVGSPEAAFFNSLSSTAFASFAQVVLQVRNGLSLSAADQQAFDNYRAAIEQAFDDLAALDESMDYSEAGNLTEAWFAQRLVLLEQIAANAANEAALENTRGQQVDAALQNALNFNAAIATALPYESARKTINELRIRHLLGQPMTQALYQQALSLAQQNAATTGAATNEVVRYLAPCDQALYTPTEEHGQERGEGQIGHKLANRATLQIAPNPTTGLIEVSLPHHDGGFLTVYNVQGQKVKTQSVASEVPKVTFDLGQAPVGLYWIVLTDEGGKVLGTAKVSVSH